MKNKLTKPIDLDLIFVLYKSQFWFRSNLSFVRCFIFVFLIPRGVKNPANKAKNYYEFFWVSICPSYLVGLLQQMPETPRWVVPDLKIPIA